MTKLLKKLTHNIAAFGAYLMISIGLIAGLGTSSAKAETTECTEVTTIPFIITVQGIYCFKHDVTTGITTGHAIDIQTNNVTIDMNGFKLGGSAAGDGTTASGIYADARKNITIRNGNIRGFFRGVWLNGVTGSGHLIEHVRADGTKWSGFQVEGDNNIVRNNHVINTGEHTSVVEAFGIHISNSSNTLIADNVVSGVSETATTYGIYVSSSSRVEVRGNSVFDIKDATNKYGIIFSSSTEVTIRENQITNTDGTGTTGIYENVASTSVACIDNITIGYVTPRAGCDLVSGHQNL